MKKKLIEELDKYKKMLQESMIFNEDGDEMNQEMPIDNHVMQDDADNDISNAEEPIDRINEIRKIALEGIQAYADNVDSEEYDFFKKIWLMCDKVQSEKETSKDNNMQ